MQRRQFLQASAAAALLLMRPGAGRSGRLARQARAQRGAVPARRHH
ncbi:hypothetical protein [Achromobacter sp. DMS1]|nr:hypothetical protein [Achromobacter sp. DMS1]